MIPSPRGVVYRCSFCGKKQTQVARLMAGPGGVYICNECITLLSHMLEPEQRVERQDWLVSVSVGDSIRGQLRSGERRSRRQRVLCELCKKPIRPKDVQVVIASCSEEGDDDPSILWRGHAECFDRAAVGQHRPEPAV